MTEEQRLRCANVTVAVTAVTQSLAEILPTMMDIRAALKVSLFLAEQFMDNPKSNVDDYREVVRQMVARELGFVN